VRSLLIQKQQYYIPGMSPGDYANHTGLDIDIILEKIYGRTAVSAAITAVFYTGLKTACMIKNSSPGG